MKKLIPQGRLVGGVIALVLLLIFMAVVAVNDVRKLFG